MFLHKVKNKYLRREALNLTRAYKKLLHTQEGETQIWKKVELLSDSVNLSAKDTFRGFLPDDFELIANQALQQKLLNERLGPDLAPSLMLAQAGIGFSKVVRLPASCRAFLQSNGVNLHGASFLFWGQHLYLNFKQGVAAYKNMCARKHGCITSDSPYSVLFGLPPTAYEGIGKDNVREHYKNLAHWVRDRFGYHRNWILSLTGTDMRSVGDFDVVEKAFPDLLSDKSRQFRAAARRIILKSVVMLFIGRWQPLYMLTGLLEFEYVRHLKKNQLANAYIFTNSYYIYRPLWTYLAEKKGSHIALVFYATNGFNYKLPHRYNGLAPGYKTMSWPVIYTHNNHHAAFLESSMMGKAIINIEGPVPFEDSGLELQIKGDKKLAFFDVQPFRPTFMASIGRPCHFYTYDASEKIFSDIAEVCIKYGVQLYCKPKRNVGPRLCRRYGSLLRRLEKGGKINIIESSVAVDRICQKVDAVICQPFTSAALYAQLYDKPVIYYDAGGYLAVGNQQACQGIPLISRKEDLFNWVQNVFDEAEVAA